MGTSKSFNLGQRKRRPAGPIPDFYATGPLRLTKLSFNLLRDFSPNGYPETALEAILERFVDAGKVVIGKVKGGALGHYGYSSELKGKGVHLKRDTLETVKDFLVILHEFGHMAGDELGHYEYVQYYTNNHCKALEELVAEGVAIALWSKYRGFTEEADAIDHLFFTVWRQRSKLWETSHKTIATHIRERVEWIEAFGR